MNEKILSSLGLAPREIKTYRTVVKIGSATPVALAKATGIKRTTAYSIARGLVEKGLLVEDATKRPRVFSPSSPAEVQEIISVEKKRLEVREKVFKQLAEELSKTEAEKTYPVPQVRFVEENKLEEFLKKQALTSWDASMLKTDATCWGYFDHSYVEQFRHVMTHYWKRAPKEISLKMLSNHSTMETEKKLKWKFPRRHVKFWKRSGNFLTGIWIMGEYVVMINTRRRPFYLVEIRDATLANDLREVFKNLWLLV